MVTRPKNKKKLEDIDEYYSFKIKNKIFQKLLRATEIRQISNGKKIRKFLLRKILLKNLKEINNFKIKKYNFYRKLHLRKHFFKKWKFFIFMQKNFHIANLKFISKFILNWKKSLLKIKEEKIHAAMNIIKCFDSIEKRNNFICRKYAFGKFEKFQNLCRRFLRKKEKENLFKFKREIKLKKIAIGILKIYIANNKFVEKLKFFRIKFSLLKLRDECIYAIANRLKKIGSKSKIKSLRNKYLKLKIRKLIFAIRALIKNKNLVMKQFKNYFLRKKIFYFLKVNYTKEKSDYESIIEKFNIKRLKQKAFFSIKENLFYIKRQEKILFEMKKFFLRSKKRKLRSIIKDWKRFYICEKFRKFKNIQKRTELFYLLKYICNKSKISGNNY